MAIKKTKTSKGPHGPSARGVRETVTASRIKENRWNPNKQSEEINIKTGKSLEVFGNVGEILVREVGPHQKAKFGYDETAGYEIIDGAHRFRFLTSAGVDNIEVRNLGTISDLEAKTLTINMNNICGAPEPIKLGELMNTLKDDGHFEDMVELFPWRGEDIESLITTVNADSYFLLGGNTRTAPQDDAQGVIVVMGSRKAKLPRDTGVPFLKQIEFLMRLSRTSEPYAVLSRLVTILEAATRKVEESNA